MKPPLDSDDLATAIEWFVVYLLIFFAALLIGVVLVGAYDLIGHLWN